MKTKKIAFVERECIKWDLTETYGYKINTSDPFFQYQNGIITTRLRTEKEKIEYRELDIIPTPRMKVSVNSSGYYEIEETFIKTIKVKQSSVYSFLNDIDSDIICIYRSYIPVNYVEYLLCFTHEFCEDSHIMKTVFPKTFSEWQEDIALLKMLRDKPMKEREEYQFRRARPKSNEELSTEFPTIDFLTKGNIFSPFYQNRFANITPKDNRGYDTYNYPFTSFGPNPTIFDTEASNKISLQDFLEEKLK